MNKKIKHVPQSETSYTWAPNISFEGVPLKTKGRKQQPKHSLSQIHKDKTKQIPRKYKYNIEE